MPAVTVHGLSEFRRDLRAIGPEWPKELRKVHKRIGDKGAVWSQRKARAMGGVHSKAAPAIKGRGDQRGASIVVSPTAQFRMANIAFWGAKKRTGWYANPRYRDSTQQHPDWVGNSWDVAKLGQGPYAINAALHAHLPELLGDYERAIDEITRKAFND